MIIEGKAKGYTHKVTIELTPKELVKQIPDQDRYMVASLLMILNKKEVKSE